MKAPCLAAGGQIRHQMFLAVTILHLLDAVSQSVITRIQTRDDRPRREISGSCWMHMQEIELVKREPAQGAVPETLGVYWHQG